jgi:predicted nucleic acid-binding protein
MDWQHQYQIVEVDASVAERAMELAEMHGLRGYDAVHLAAAVALQEMRQVMQLAPRTFVSSDAQQLQTALNTGFPVEDPNQHP